MHRSRTEDFVTHVEITLGRKFTIAGTSDSFRVRTGQLNVVVRHSLKYVCTSSTEKLCSASLPTNDQSFKVDFKWRVSQRRAASAQSALSFKATKEREKNAQILWKRADAQTFSCDDYSSVSTDLTRCVFTCRRWQILIDFTWFCPITVSVTNQSNDGSLLKTYSCTVTTLELYFWSILFVFYLYLFYFISDKTYKSYNNDSLFVRSR